MATTLDRLERTWSPPAGLMGWLTAVNHRTVGLRYITTALILFLIAGAQALVIRLQLAQPGLSILSPEAYNQVFTMHGTTMMFLFAVPVMEGIGIYLVPLMIGARDMAFPRLNAFGYWVYLIAALTLYWSFLVGSAPDGGWFAYVPLTGPEYSQGLNIDYYVTAITFLEIAALVAAVELIVTIFKLRAPGMAIHRMPLFVWAILVMAFMIVFAMPPLMVGSVMLALDRMVGTHFFNVAQGGDPLLWQHLFWFFGHPEVYIVLIPALGVVSSIVATFTRRAVIGYTPIVLSIVSIGLLSFGLWVHHMYTTGLPALGENFFAAASMMIAIPSGIQIFAWIATIWEGKPVWRTPFLFVMGFLIIFVLGGITGVMVASVPFDAQVHDTYFVVAHFHYVLIGGSVFPLLGGLHYWFPKAIGKLPSERLGRWSFWLLFLGFNIAFFPMHITGFLGMPRRVYTYLPGLGWDVLNLVSTIGAFVFALGALVFAYNMVRSARHGPLADDNPWGAGTLEWATSSPPPPYNFRVVPEVRSREPLWEQERWWASEPPAERQASIVADPEAGRRETPGTSLLDGRVMTRVVLPGPSLWPLGLAIAVAITFIGSLISLWLVPIGALLTYVAIVGWTWPNRARPQAEVNVVAAETPDPQREPVAGSEAPMWWGIVMLIVIETTVFATLITSYFYLSNGAAEWPLGGFSPPDLLLPTINLGVLLLSGGAMYWGDRGIHQGNQRRLIIGLLISFALGVVFLVLKYIEYSDNDYLWDTNAYGSVVWTITGFHSAHVIALLLKTLTVLVLAWQGFFTEKRNLGVEVNGFYWQFVVVVWLPLYAVLYLAPRWL